MLATIVVIMIISDFPLVKNCHGEMFHQPDYFHYHCYNKYRYFPSTDIIIPLTTFPCNMLNYCDTY